MNQKKSKAEQEHPPELPIKVNVTPAAQEALRNLGSKLARVPAFSFPPIKRSAFDLAEIARVPTQEEVNVYQSASVLVRELAEEAARWKNRLPESFKPALLAVLYGGIQIQVQTLSKVSFHGIRIEGTMDDAPCSLLAHQSTVQLLCYAEKIEAGRPRNPIGFVWDDNSLEV